MIGHERNLFTYNVCLEKGNILSSYNLRNEILLISYCDFSITPPEKIITKNDFAEMTSHSPQIRYEHTNWMLINL